MQLHMKIRPGPTTRSSGTRQRSLAAQERRNKRKAERGFGPLAEGDRSRDRPSGRPSGSGEWWDRSSGRPSGSGEWWDGSSGRPSGSGDTWWSGWGGSEWWGGSRRWQSWERR